MSQSIRLWGATYSGVGGVKLPLSTSGTALFTDVSDTTAAAGDVASGKYFYTSAGVKTQGTASGGGGGNDFIVTLTYNSTSQMWEPDCTFSELSTAYYDGKTIAVNDPYGNVTASGYFVPGDDPDKYWYYVAEQDYQASTVTIQTYYFDAETLYIDYTETFAAPPNLQAKSNINPTTSSQTITPDSGYDALSSVQINAMPSGSAGTPTATKGTVSNHSVSVTPSVTNTTGYITGSTKTGTAVTVSASELVSGSETKTANGTYDVTNLASLVVNVSGGGSLTVKQTTWNVGNSTTVSHTFSSLSGTPKAAILRCTSQLTRSSSNTYYYIADIIWDGTDAWGNYHLRSNGTFNNVAKDAASGFNVSTGTNSITFSSDASSRSSAPGSFYNGTYELTYWY